MYELREMNKNTKKYQEIERKINKVNKELIEVKKLVLLESEKLREFKINELRKLKK